MARPTLLQALVKGRRGTPSFASSSPITAVSAVLQKTLFVTCTRPLDPLNLLRQVFEISIEVLELPAEVFVLFPVDRDVHAFSKAPYGVGKRLVLVMKHQLGLLLL